jgi:hypothetical protein
VTRNAIVELLNGLPEKMQTELLGLVAAFEKQ